jgi:MFS family permease
MGTSADIGTMVRAEGLATPPGAATPESTARNPLRWFVFAVVIAANIMDLMDATIVNVAGPSIRAALGGSVSTLQWLSAGYTLAFAVFLITGARLGDMFGRRRLFLIGSAGFTVMSAGFALIGRLGRHMLHLGVAIVAVGTVVLALTATGAHTASTLDLAPGLFLIGLGAGASLGQLFDFILAGVTMNEVGSASGVLEAVQQLSSAVGVAALGTIFFSAFADHLPTQALAITAWACLAPIAVAFALIFRLPMQAREPQV